MVRRHNKHLDDITMATYDRTTSDLVKPKTAQINQQSNGMRRIWKLNSHFADALRSVRKIAPETTTKNIQNRKCSSILLNLFLYVNKCSTERNDQHFTYKRLRGLPRNQCHIK